MFRRWLTSGEVDPLNLEAFAECSINFQQDTVQTQVTDGNLAGLGSAKDEAVDGRLDGVTDDRDMRTGHTGGGEEACDAAKDAATPAAPCRGASIVHRATCAHSPQTWAAAMKRSCFECMKNSIGGVPSIAAARPASSHLAAGADAAYLAGRAIDTAGPTAAVAQSTPHAKSASGSIDLH